VLDPTHVHAGDEDRAYAERHKRRPDKDGEGEISAASWYHSTPGGG
jgi:hypothetical protein